VTRFQTLHEIVRRARTNLARNEWDYLIGGAETETTLRRNRLALDRLALRPRVLRDVSSVSTERTLLGERLRLPVLLAPIGSIQVFEAGGGLSVAQAAEQFGTMMILSSACQPDFETVAREAGGANIYQLYAVGDDAWLMDIVARSQDAGYRAFCLTVDTQVYSRRERDIAKRYVPASGRRVSAGGGDLIHQARLTWDTVARIKERFEIPLVLKGVATGDDARIACENGVDVIYVSNHGGRQLDHGLGAIDVLPEVVAAVAGRAPVVVDGGILRGTDVVKALALGADAVGMGRLLAFAMAAGGAEAIVRALEILEQEVRIALALLGVTHPDALTPEMVVAADPVGPTHVTSAFPLLDEGY